MKVIQMSRILTAWITKTASQLQVARVVEKAYGAVAGNAHHLETTYRIDVNRLESSKKNGDALKENPCLPIFLLTMPRQWLLCC